MILFLLTLMFGGGIFVWACRRLRGTKSNAIGTTIYIDTDSISQPSIICGEGGKIVVRGKIDTPCIFNTGTISKEFWDKYCKNIPQANIINTGEIN